MHFTKLFCSAVTGTGWFINACPCFERLYFIFCHYSYILLNTYFRSFHNENLERKVKNIELSRVFITRWGQKLNITSKKFNVNDVWGRQNFAEKNNINKDEGRKLTMFLQRSKRVFVVTNNNYYINRCDILSSPIWPPDFNRIEILDQKHWRFTYFYYTLILTTFTYFCNVPNMCNYK